MNEKRDLPETPVDLGQDGPALALRVSPVLRRQILEKARSLGVSEEEYISLALVQDLSGGERLEPLMVEVRKTQAKNDQIFSALKENLDEVNEKNRIAYESLLKSMKPDRKEWGVIGGAGALVGLLLILVFVTFVRKIPETPVSHGGVGNGQTALPAQMSSKDRYTYFVGLWYLGVRDRMSTKDRLFLENYLKPFDNFDDDLKARKKAGL
jgi:hypothetical protein